MPDNTEITEYSRFWLSAQTEKTLTVDKINVQLLMLQTAFPTSTKNYSREEFQALQSLWYNIFKHVPEDILNEAVRRFIINDRKGFFPAPGQIVGYVEQVVSDREFDRLMAANDALIRRRLEEHQKQEGEEN